MAAHSRRSLSLALTLALTLVSGSSLWHHDHEQPDLHSARTDCRLDTLSLGSRQAADYCPICLTHRLLTQSWIQEAKEAVAPIISARHRIYPLVLPAVEHSDSPEARAPPLC
jgi:hypothetical protein